MKRWSIPLLICCLLTGCTTAPAAVREPVEAAVPPAPVEAAEEERFHYVVDLATWEDASQDEDGTVLVNYRISLPEMTACRSDGTAVQEAGTAAEENALAVERTFNDQFAPWLKNEEFQEMTEMAREDRLWQQEQETGRTVEYFMELDCQVYQTERLVSAAGNYYSYTGGAHPNRVLMAWNFDLETGEFFAPEQLAEDGEAFSQAVQAEIVRQIRERAEEYGLAAEEMFWSSYEEIAAGWSSYAVSFDEEGMTVAFSPYELAAYAAGPQSFFLSYDLLSPYLSGYGRAVLGLEES